MTTNYSVHKQSTNTNFGNFNNIVTNVGCAGLILMALFAWMGTAVALLGFVMLFFATVFHPQFRSEMASYKVFNIALCLIGALCLYHIGSSVLENDESINDQLLDTFRWSFFFLFPITAFWLRGDSKKIYFILLLAFIGLMLGILIREDWDIFFDSARMDFGRGPIAYSLLLGSSVLGLILFSYHFWKFSKNRILQLTSILFWIVSLLFVIQFTIQAQSRATWFGLGLVLIGLGVYGLVKYKKGHFKLNKISLAALVSVILLTAVSLYNIKTIQVRFFQEKQVFSAIMDFELANVPYSSIGTRVHLNLYGIEKWLEKPILGWGQGTQVVNDIQAANPEYGKLHYLNHLHNTYIETLVRFGLVGVSLIGILLFLVLKSFKQHFDRGKVPTDIYLFVISTLALTAFWSVGTFRIIHVDFRFFWLILMGIAFSYNFSHLDTEREVKSEKKL